MTEEISLKIQHIEDKLDTIIEKQGEIIPVIKNHNERIQRLEDVPAPTHAERITKLEQAHSRLLGMGALATFLLTVFGPILSWLKGTH